MTVQPGLCRTWSETPKTCFLTTRLNYGHSIEAPPKLFPYQNIITSIDLLKNLIHNLNYFLQYYYNGNTGQFLYWDAEQSMYLPAPDQTGGEGGKDDKKEGKDKTEKVKVAKKIAKV